MELDIEEIENKFEKGEKLTKEEFDFLWESRLNGNL